MEIILFHLLNGRGSLCNKRNLFLKIVTKNVSVKLVEIVTGRPHM